METKKRTLGEIAKNPASMSNEEKEELLKLFKNSKELGKAFEPYSDIEPILKNNTNTLSERFYQEHFIMSAVLEAFSFKNEISFKDLNKTIVNYVPQEFIWAISVNRINRVIEKMIRLGLVEPIERDNKYAPNFKITNDGIKAYQEHTFQTLATSSFFNYQTYQLNKKADRMSRLMFGATILSILVAISSVIVTISVTSN